MNTKRFFKAMAFTTSWEGGFANHPDDPGAATCFGVTQKNYDVYRLENVLQLQSVAQIDRLEVLNIFREKYWIAGSCDSLKAPLDIAHFDTCVNFGVSHAVMFLQQSLGVDFDGQMGPLTLAAADACDPREVALLVSELRIGFRYDRCEQKPSQRVFLEGWLNRDNALKKLVGVL
jgi:lysozyme family protein